MLFKRGILFSKINIIKMKPFLRQVNSTIKKDMTSISNVKKSFVC